MILLLSSSRGISPSTKEGFGAVSVLGLAGLMVTTFGIVRIVSGSGKSTAAFAPHVELSFRTGGMISALTGLVMLSLAVGLIVTPGLLNDLFEQSARLATRLVFLFLH